MLISYNCATSFKCFDTVGWVTGITTVLHGSTHSQNAAASLPVPPRGQQNPLDLLKWRDRSVCTDTDETYVSVCPMVKMIISSNMYTVWYGCHSSFLAQPALRLRYIKEMRYYLFHTHNFTHKMVLTQASCESSNTTHDVIEMCAPAAPPIRLRIRTRSLNPNLKP